MARIGYGTGPENTGSNPNFIEPRLDLAVTSATRMIRKWYNQLKERIVRAETYCSIRPNKLDFSVHVTSEFENDLVTRLLFFFFYNKNFYKNTKKIFQFLNKSTRQIFITNNI